MAVEGADARGFLGPDLEDEILAALSVTDPSVDRSELLQNLGARVEGTCEWILGNPIYRDWLESPMSRLLWLRGPAATGKTFMSIFFTDALEGMAENAQVPSPVTFFFCTYQTNRGVRNSATAILRGLLLQLIERQADLLQILKPDFRRYRSNNGLFGDTNQEILWRNFTRVLASVKADAFYAVIDGLDECDSQTIKWIAEKFNSLCSPALGRLPVKVIFTSRDIQDSVGHIFPNRPWLSLDPVQQRGVVDDIDRVIDHKVSNLSRTLPWLRDRPDVKDHILQILREKADSTFLWIGFVMDELKRANLSTLEQVLDDMPKGLNGMYERMLSKIAPDRRPEIRELLLWCTFAVRPLSLSELAVATNTRNTQFATAEGAMRDKIRLAGGILHLRRSRFVHFIHHSARNFLVGLGPANYPDLAEFYMDKGSANLRIARMCFSHVQSGPHAGGPVDLRTREVRETYPLLEYACFHWPAHARESPPEVADMFDAFPAFYQRRSPIRDNWLRSYWQLSAIQGMSFPKAFDITHLAAFFGINSLLRHIISNSPFRQATYTLSWRAFSIFRGQFGAQMDPIHWACRNGYLECVKILLNHGASAHSKGFGMTPLAWAARNGHHEIMKVLLRHGASIEAESYGLPPLHWATLYGKYAAVELLLGRGANVNSVGTAGMSKYLSAPKLALSEFPWGSLPEREALILSKDAEKDARAQAQLKWDTARGWVRIDYALNVFVVNLLGMVVENTLVTAAVVRSENSAYLASRKGNLDDNEVCWANVTLLGRLFLWWDLMSDFGVLRMKAAEYMGRMEYVLLGLTFLTTLAILFKGYRVYSESPEDFVRFLTFEAIFVAILTLVGVAKFVGVFILLTRPIVLEVTLLGTEALAVYSSFYEPWLGYSSTVWRLGAVLFAILAATLTHYQVDTRLPMKFLILAESIVGGIVDIRSKIVYGNTALHLASGRGHSGLIRLLLEKGAQIDITDSAERSALDFAQANSHFQAVHMLLQHMTTADDGLDDFPSTVQLAAITGRLGVLQWLVDSGHDVDERSVRGWSPIHSAAYLGDHVTVYRLKGMRANLNARSLDGVSPLLVATCGNSKRVVDILLESHADVNETTIEGTSPLLIAVWIGSAELTRTLLDSGANAGIVDRLGNTVLDLARNNPEIVNMLQGQEVPVSRDRKARSTETVAQLALQFLGVPREKRRFERLGFYLLRLGDVEAAREAYRWARPLAPDVPWFFCQGCQNTRKTDRLWICLSCCFTFTEPLLCDGCYADRCEDSPRLLGCQMSHAFTSIALPLEADGSDLDQVQSHWLRGRLDDVSLQVSASAEEAGPDGDDDGAKADKEEHGGPGYGQLDEALDHSPLYNGTALQQVLGMVDERYPAISVSPYQVGGSE